MEKDNKIIKQIEFAPRKVELFLEEQGWTQKELNQAMGYKNPNVVNKIIRGSRKASANDLIKFCCVLNKNVSDFVEQA